MTDDELAEFDAAMDEQGKELRNALADDLGGEPAEYQGDWRAGTRRRRVGVSTCPVVDDVAWARHDSEHCTA